MKLAVISDLHADFHALRDALAQMQRLGCQLVVCAGDIVDVGVFPEETIALLVERGIPTIRGNHDRWALRAGRSDEPNAAGDEHDASDRDLSDAALSFLRALPLSWTATIEGVRVAMHHANVGSDLDGIYDDQLDECRANAALDAADADVLIVGHTHCPLVFGTANGRLIANPGALSRGGAQGVMVFDPEQQKFVRREPPPRGTFGVLHLPERRFVVHSAADGRELEMGSTR